MILQPLRNNGIVVFNTPGANANGVKELVIAALLLASRDLIGGVQWAKTLVDEGDKVPALIEKGKANFGGSEIKGKTLAVVGLGAIGVLVANAAQSLGMNVVGYDPYISVEHAWNLHHDVVRAFSIESMLAKADFITLHIPLIADTKGFIDAGKLIMMKNGVKILNFARGELVVDSDIVAAIKTKKVGAYFTDFPNAELGKKSGGLMNLPLKLALYLLKDVHGDITLDLPVKGDLNDPKINIGKLVWQVFKNFIVKIVASPFRALSGLVGVDPDEIRGIQFNYADTTLTDSHLRRIKLFTELEKKKPDMKIELASYNDIELEKQEIAIDEAGKLFKAATGADYKREKKQFATFLSEKLKADTVNMISGSLKLIGDHKLDSIQNRYSQLRIHKIEKALHNINDSTKVRMLIPNREVPENVGSRPVFELKFSIEE